MATIINSTNGFEQPIFNPVSRSEVLVAQILPVLKHLIFPNTEGGRPGPTEVHDREEKLELFGEIKHIVQVTKCYEYYLLQ